MVKNNIEIDVKVKCLEEHKTQADIAKIVGTPASYVNKLIRLCKKGRMICVNSVVTNLKGGK